MFSDALVKIEGEEAAPVIDEINQTLEDTSFDPGKSVVLGQNIPFYPDHKYIDISDYEAVPHRQRFVIYKPGSVVVMNWTNDPIYKLNKEVPLTLNEKNVASYARFFFSHVRGRHGRFILIDSVDDIRWREEPPPVVRKAVGKMIQPVSILSHDAGNYVLQSCMVFKDALFKAKVNVSADGVVNLSDEELLIEDMPILDDVFNQ